MGTTPMMQVILDAGIPDADRNIVTLHTYLLMNTGGGRPSACARLAVEDYKRLGPEGFIAAHHAANQGALRTCGCSVCLRDLDRP